jgi:hypothetical protein
MYSRPKNIYAFAADHFEGLLRKRNEGEQEHEQPFALRFGGPWRRGNELVSDQDIIHS